MFLHESTILPVPSDSNVNSCVEVTWNDPVVNSKKRSQIESLPVLPAGSTI